jgi:hypothetical protein
LVGSYFPKPVEILTLIQQGRHQDVEVYRAPTQEEIDRLKADQAGFFASPEYKAFIKRMDGKTL